MATVILVGHGSSCDSGAGAPVRAHAARLRAEGAFRRVQPAFWKEAPHVGDVLAATTDEDVAIVPMFMSDGYFASQVLPRALGLHGPVTRRGAQRIHYTAPVGTHPRVPRLVERRALEVGAGPTSAVVIVGHGTERHALSDDSTWAAVRVLRNSGRFGVVAGAFLEEEPRIARTLEQLEAQHIVVVPFFLAEGDHTLTDIPAAAMPAGGARNRRITVTPPVGTLPEIARLAAELARAALGERPGDDPSRQRGWLSDAALGDGDFQRTAPSEPATVVRAATTRGGEVWVPSIS